MSEGESGGAGECEMSAAGGKPVMSSDNRRRSVAASAGGDGDRPSFSKRAKIKRSTSLFGQAVFFTDGTAGRTGAVNAQWALYSAPSATQRRKRSFSAADSDFFESA